MTIQQIDAAIRAAGCGWDQQTQMLVLAADATPGFCNKMQCESLATGAARSGATAEDIGAAALALVNGDKGPMRELLSP